MHRSHQAISPSRVELGEDIVENDHRIAGGVFHSQDLRYRKSKRENKRPRFTVARIPLDGQIVQGEMEVIPMRTHETDASVELLLACARQCVSESCSNCFT